MWERKLQSADCEADKYFAGCFGEESPASGSDLGSLMFVLSIFGPKTISCTDRQGCYDSPAR